MADTKTITIQQTVHRPHHETVVRRWYDIIERTITREIHPDGSIAVGAREHRTPYLRIAPIAAHAQ